MSETVPKRSRSRCALVEEKPGTAAMTATLGSALFARG
jgi:hypothetical protein